MPNVSEIRLECHTTVAVVDIVLTQYVLWYTQHSLLNLIHSLISISSYSKSQ